LIRTSQLQHIFPILLFYLVKKFEDSISTNQKMMKFLFVVLAVLLFGINSKTLGESLGYPKDARILIVNADDFGMSYSENKG
jgi:hypothetical protein